MVKFSQLQLLNRVYPAEDYGMPLITTMRMKTQVSSQKSFPVEVSNRQPAHLKLTEYTDIKAISRQHYGIKTVTVGLAIHSHDNFGWC